MQRFRWLAVSALFVAMAGAAHATWYTSEAAFVAAIQPSYYLEDFPNFTPGSPLNGTQTSWTAPGANGYGWTATTNDNTGLYSLRNALSTAMSHRNLVLTFSGNPVTAFGGNLGNTDVEGLIIPGTATITLSTSESQSISLGSSLSFLGWVGSSPISSVSIGSSDFIRLQHAYTGAVPEPASLLALASGSLLLFRRRSLRRR
jgi:hypothetical protein